ncbi:hypothetical protein E7811_08850 [Aliigemmobacter aestuarii]|uniref:FAS1 domain-containing protein n=1 Tax=Aliigemmobacter aestuarii TaxID=1445661 RepID=A0A4S3MT49_9RHOB|nr:fasciclin domain-containing protein [Gemmobacter aestuarii]THD85776.1 hypothetical protein E7811_08850 [Gemmobacter aestuarii]
MISTTSIAGIALGDARFNILVNALTYVDATLSTSLVSTLADPSSNLTVFAPTDAAFAQLAKDLGYTGSLTDEAAVTTFLTTNLTAETIRDVILYHVSAGAKTLAQVAALDEVPTLNGATFAPDGVTLVDKEPDLLNPSLIQTNVTADNGIIHVIDRVLLPIDLPGNDAPTIAGIVASSGAFDRNGADFDLLLAAVQAAGLAGALNDPDADLTAFAPNDAAFLGLARALGFKGGSEEAAFGYLVRALTLLSGGEDPIPLLTDILTYHVAPESLQSSQVLATDSIATLLGTSLDRNGTKLVDADPQIPNPSLIATDIQAANGIVHVIDGVLIPANILRSNGSNDVDFIIDGARASRIVTGADNDWIDGGANADRIHAGSGNDVVLGGRGADTIGGDAGRDLVRGGDGRDVVRGGAGADTVDGGAGNDRLVGGTGRDTFVFAEDYGRDRIVDFQNGRDRIDVSGTDVDSFAELRGLITTGRNAVTIDFGDGDQLVLNGVTRSQLDASDFLFG